VRPGHARGEGRLTVSTSGMALVLGADIEGLAAAATLARAGRSVHVIDARIHAGGVAARLPFADGYSAPGLLNECALIRRSLLVDLGLERHGLSWHPKETAIHVMQDGAPPIRIHGERVDGVESADAEIYRDWRAFLDRIATFVRHVIDSAPPEVDEPGLTDLLELARQGYRLRSLGDKDMMELLRIVTLPAWDWMGEQFSSDALKAGLVAPVLTGTVVGPRAAGTTAMMLMRETTRGVGPVGGLASLVDALVRRCEELGVTFRFGQAPASILIDPQERRVRGVLCGGEELEAELVISALDPARTLLDLVEPGLLPHHVEGELKGWRARGDTAIQLIACSTAPEFGGDNDRDSIDRMFTARSLDDLVHGVSHGGSVGWDDGARSLLRDRIGMKLEQDCPGIRDSIVGDLLLTPCDLDDQFNLPGGHLHRGEQALDQLWLQRPSIALSQYSTPIAGLFLAGAGSHPGGPYLGGAGVLGARRALTS